jgi:hypothetical protein
MKIIKYMLLTVATWGGLFTMADPAFAQTWTQTSAPSESWIAVASSSDGSKLIAGGFGLIYGISTNSGSTWITNTQPQMGSTYYGSWSSVAISADGTTYVGTIGNVIWVSTNSGIAWLSNNVPSASFFVSVVALSADGSKMVAGAGAYGGSPSGIYISTNSGVTWAQTTAPTNNWTSVASSADGTKLVAAAMNSEGGFIYASMDSGLTWTLTGAPTNNSWATVASSADGSKLVAASGYVFIPALSYGGYGGVYTSTNFGMSWTSNNVPDAQWQSVAASADGTKLVAVALEPFGLICSSTNSGASWVSNSAPNESWYSVASSADGNKLMAAALGDQSFNPVPIYTLQTTPSPQMNITPTNGNLTLSWIVPSTDFVMQQSSDLGSWMDMTNKPVLNLTNLQNEVILSPTGSNVFYRLKTP